VELLARISFAQRYHPAYLRRQQGSAAVEKFARRGGPAG